MYDFKQLFKNTLTRISTELISLEILWILSCTFKNLRGSFLAYSRLPKEVRAVGIARGHPLRVKTSRTHSFSAKPTNSTWVLSRAQSARSDQQSHFRGRTGSSRCWRCSPAPLLECTQLYMKSTWCAAATGGGTKGLNQVDSVPAPSQSGEAPESERSLPVPLPIWPPTPHGDNGQLQEIGSPGRPAFPALNSGHRAESLPRHIRSPHTQMQGLSTAFPGRRAGLGGFFLTAAPTGVSGPARRLRPSSGLRPAPGPKRTGSCPPKAGDNGETRTDFPAHCRGRGNSARVPGSGVTESWTLAVRARGGADGASSPEPTAPPRTTVTRRRAGVGWPGRGGSPLGLGDGAPQPAPRRPPGAGARPRRSGPSGSAGAPGPPGPSFRRRLSPSRPSAQVPPPPAPGRTHVDRVDVGSVEEVERGAQLQGWRDEVVSGLQLQVPMFGAERKELLAAQAAPRPR